MNLSWPFSKTYRFKCQDGSIKIIYKNVNDAFPLFIPGWKSGLSSSIKGWEKVKAKVKADFATRIEGLFYSLDESNRSLMLQFRSAYILFQSDPLQNSPLFSKQVERINEKQQKYLELRIKLQSLITIAELYPNDSDKTIPIYREIANELGGKYLSETARLEIDDNRNLAKNWAGGPDGK
jgi:hypothetical protein